MRKSTVVSWALFLTLGACVAGRCIAAQGEPLSSQGAIALAEKFVSEQGFKDLQPKAVGARLESGLWFVGFRSTVGEQIRGVTVSDDGKKLKRVSQSLRLDWLTSLEQTTELGAAEAQGLAETFAVASGVKGVAKRAAKMTEQPTGAWWAWFEKTAKKGSAPSFAIVSVDKKTRQAAWVKSDAAPAKPAKAAKPTKK